MGGGSKIKSAAGVCSWDTGEHCWSWSPSLPGIGIWLGKTLRAGGVRGHCVGLYLVFVALRRLHLVGNKHHTPSGGLILECKQADRRLMRCRKVKPWLKLEINSRISNSTSRRDLIFSFFFFFSCGVNPNGLFSGWNLHVLHCCQTSHEIESNYK